jgi:hypothetical protein
LPVRRLNGQVRHCFYFNPHPDLAWMRELTGSFCYYWFLTTLELFKYMLSRLMRLYSLLSSASEMIPLHACTVKRFLYEFCEIAIFRYSSRPCHTLPSRCSGFPLIVCEST